VALTISVLVIPAQAGIQLLAFRSAKLPLALRASGLLLALLQASCPSPLRGQLRCSRRSCGAVPKSRQKARRRTRCPAARHARRGVPVLLGAGGVVWQYVRVLSADARASCARPCRAFSAVACDARHRERRRDPRIRASLHYLEAVGRRVAALAVVSAAGCRPNGAPCGAASARRKSPQEGAHDVRPFAECTRTYIRRTPQRVRALGGQATAWMPEVEQRRSSCRMPGERATGGVLSFGDFSLHKHCAAGAARTAQLAAEPRRAGCPESRKLPARPQGEWKLCT
jgi:hypothetical protein